MIAGVTTFRGRLAAAPLTPNFQRAVRSDSLTFRGRLAAAPLTPDDLADGIVLALPFRGRLAAAPLTPTFALAYRLAVELSAAVWPRPH